MTLTKSWTHWLVMAGVLLVALALLLPNAHAQVSQASSNPTCADIDVYPSQIPLFVGQETQTVFSVQNNARDDFFIDRVEVWDNVEGIRTEVRGHSSRIPALDFGTIGIWVKGLDSGNQADPKGYVAVFGHFRNNTVCTSSQIGVGSFDLRVQEIRSNSTSYFSTLPSVRGGNRVSYACPNVYADVPVEWNMANGDEFLARLVNDSDYRVTFFFGGDGVSASPSGVSVPAKSEFEQSVRIRSDRRIASMGTIIQSAGCSGTKWTRIENPSVKREGLNYGPSTTDAYGYDDPVPVAPAMVSTDTDRVTVNATARSDSNGYDVAITLLNEGNRPVNGFLNALVPEGWIVSGAKNVTVPANGQQSAGLRIVPPAGQTDATNAIVAFGSGSTKVLAPVTLAAMEPEQSVGLSFAGLFALGSDTVGFLTGNGWIVLLLILVVAWLFIENERKRAVVEPWMKNQPNPALQKEQLQTKAQAPVLSDHATHPDYPSARAHSGEPSSGSSTHAHGVMTPRVGPAGQ